MYLIYIETDTREQSTSILLTEIRGTRTCISTRYILLSACQDMTSIVVVCLDITFLLSRPRIINGSSSDN